MILGISLVVNELHKGPRLVFRYPEATPAWIEASPFQGISKLYDQYYSLSPEDFAKLFRQKSSLYNKILELTIDNLNFISFPCPCPKTPQRENATSPHPDQGDDNQVTDNQVKDIISSFHIIVTTVSKKAMLKINRSFMFRCQEKHLNKPGVDPIASSMGLSNPFVCVCRQTIKRVVELVSKSLSEQEVSNRYINEQVSLMIKLIDSYSNQTNDYTFYGVEAISPENDLFQSSNTGVVVFNRSRRNFSNSSSSSNSAMISGNGLVHNSKNMQMTQSGSNENLDEIESMINSISEPLGLASPSYYNQQSSSVGLLSGTSVDNNESYSQSHNWGIHLMDVFLMNSSLANELRNLFHNLSGGHSLNISFNSEKSKSVVLFCKNIRQCEDSTHLIELTNNPYLISIYSNDIYLKSSSDLQATLNKGPFDKGNKDFHEYNRFKGINLNTQTILTMANADTILKILGSLDGRNFSNNTAVFLSSPGAVSPQPDGGGGGLQGPFLPHEPEKSRLYNFLEKSDPTKSFFDLSLILNEPPEELVSMTNYLRNWGLAEIINVIYEKSCYRVHPQAPCSLDSHVARAYETLVLGFDIDRSQIKDPQHESKNSFNGSQKKGTPSRSYSSTVKQSSDQMYGQISQPIGSVPYHYMVGLNDLQRSQFSYDDKSETVANTDQIDNIPQELSLPALLLLFTGNRTIYEVISYFPQVLKEYAIDILIFLLRWQMLVQVNSYVFNLLEIQPCNEEYSSYFNLNGNTTPREELSRGKGKESPSFGKDNQGEELPYDLKTPIQSPSKPIAIRKNLPDTDQLPVVAGPDTDFSWDVWNSAIFENKLSAAQKASLSKISSYLKGSVISSKSFDELVWIGETTQEELMDIFHKLPFLRIVKKST